jgi:hypothetical protein
MHSCIDCNFLHFAEKRSLSSFVLGGTRQKHRLNFRAYALAFECKANWCSSLCCATSKIQSTFRLLRRHALLVTWWCVHENNEVFIRIRWVPVQLSWVSNSSSVNWYFKYNRIRFRSCTKTWAYATLGCWDLELDDTCYKVSCLLWVPFRVCQVLCRSVEVIHPAHLVLCNKQNIIWIEHTCLRPLW